MISIILVFKVSGIGVLPILLVIISALFLWGMVVYNSLKTRKNNMETYLQNVGKLAFQRVQLLTELGNLLKVDLITNPEGYDENTLQSEARLLDEKITNLSLQNDPQLQKLQASLGQNAASLVQSQRKFRSARKTYNELCQHMPYRLVAALFAYKPSVA